MQQTSTAFSPACAVGDALPPLMLPPVSRTDLALYAGASGDVNPMHIDIDAAKAAGFDDVFVHGMLIMAYMGRLLTGWAPQEKLRELSGRFVTITKVHDRLICSGKVIELTDLAGERCVRLSVNVITDAGEIRIKGEALVAF